MSELLYGDWRVIYKLNGVEMVAVVTDCEGSENAYNQFEGLYNFDEVLSVEFYG